MWLSIKQKCFAWTGGRLIGLPIRSPTQEAFQRFMILLVLIIASWWNGSCNATSLIRGIGSQRLCSIQKYRHVMIG